MRSMRLVRNLTSVLMATFSLILMVAAFNLDAIVNENLYAYGLQFSPEWGIPYWTAIRTIFGVAWLNLIVAVTLQIYAMTRKAKEKAKKRAEKDNISEEPWTGERREIKLENKEHWHTYRLSDGSTIKVKNELKSTKRLDKYSPDGMPIYVVEYDNIVQVVSVPEKLAKKPKELPAYPDKTVEQERKEAIQMFVATPSDFEQAEEQKETEIVVSRGRKRHRNKKGQ